ncbi:hypothetical protein ACTD5D_10260 [Nocardia takedensis]|uniref:hypothetical protein n=1 Tax=Nocardia takedensis TaxID=259390 RepID=UPI003F773CD3
MALRASPELNLSVDNGTRLDSRRESLFSGAESGGEAGRNTRHRHGREGAVVTRGDAVGWKVQALAVTGVLDVSGLLGRLRGSGVRVDLDLVFRPGVASVVENQQADRD